MDTRPMCERQLEIEMHTRTDSLQALPAAPSGLPGRASHCSHAHTHTLHAQAFLAATPTHVGSTRPTLARAPAA